MIWFKRTRGLDTDTMRQIATDAEVTWSAQSIVYCKGGIGYADGDSADVTAIQDAAENLLGYRPVQINTPSQTTQE